MFQNWLLWLFEPNRADVTREWRKLHNEDVNDLNSSPNIIRVIKLRRMRWAGHVERMGREGETEREEVHTEFWWGKMKKRDLLEDLGIDGRIIKNYLQETGWRIVEWINLDQDRNRWRIVVKKVLSLSVP